MDLVDLPCPESEEKNEDGGADEQGPLLDALERMRWATSGGMRLNFFTDLSGSGRARPMGDARTGPTSEACSSVKPSLEWSTRSSGDTRSTGSPTCSSNMGTKPSRSVPPPVTSTRPTGRRPGSDAKYWTEFLISLTRSCIDAMAARLAACIWVESSPILRLTASASLIGRSRAAEMAAVVAFPPAPTVRTNCGRPCWWMTTTVRPAPTETMASGCSVASCPPMARTRAEEMRSTPSTVSPAFSTASITPLTRSAWAAATRTRRILSPSGDV